MACGRTVAWFTHDCFCQLQIGWRTRRTLFEKIQTDFKSRTSFWYCQWGSYIWFGSLSILGTAALVSLWRGRICWLGTQGNRPATITGILILTFRLFLRKKKKEIIWYVHMFIEWWNTEKSISDIWQGFSHVFHIYEGIKKYSRHLVLTMASWDTC